MSVAVYAPLHSCGTIWEDNMKFRRRQFLRLAAGAVVYPAISRIASAQTYPARPITIIVPFAAGGSTDALARIIAERMRTSLGQTIIIENAGGAAGSIAVGRVVRAAADGYTLSIRHWGTHVVNGATYSLQYDLLKDLAPIALLATTPTLINSKNALPAKSLLELVAWLEANPDKATQGSGGSGSAAHIQGVFFQQRTGTRFRHVPYRGGGPALQDLVAGQIDLMVDQAANSIAQVRAGKIRTYAVAAKTRMESDPDIPTVDEAGLPGLYMSVWHGLWAPSATPKDVIAKLNAAVVEGLADPTVRRRFAEITQDIPASSEQTPEALGAFQRAEAEKWWPVIKAANIKGE
jgi:tripartite-type tricarboxylate transporter receptor subunit TctC